MIRKSFFEMMLTHDDDLGMSSTLSKNWKLIDTDQYDIKPKKEYYRRVLRQTEESLEQVRKARDNTVSYYTTKENDLLAEIERIKKEL